jgi:protein O-GlcNAc transferase
MKLISYSLWGKNPLYTYGIIENVEKAKVYFSDFIVRIYYNSSVPEKIINFLNKQDNVQLIKMENNISYQNVIWRFLPMFEDFEIVLCRDADSRIDQRERLMFDQFIESNKKFYMIREMGGRGTLIGGGCWGVKDGFLNRQEIKEIFNKTKFSNSFYTKQTNLPNDQHFLNKHIYPLIKNDMIIFYNPKYGAKNDDIQDKNIIRDVPPSNKNPHGSKYEDISLACQLLNEDNKRIKKYLRKRYEDDIDYGIDKSFL